jgi:hypothetical protein
MSSISRESKTYKPGSIASPMSHERSCRVMIAISPTMTAARPHKSINIVKDEYTNGLQCRAAEKGINTMELRIQRIMNATPSQIERQPMRVLGHPRMRDINGSWEVVALPGTPESFFILCLLMKIMVKEKVQFQDRFVYKHLQ